MLKIIDEECVACTCFETCGTDVMKGSILCSSKRISAKQTKADMYRKMQEGVLNNGRRKMDQDNNRCV